MYPFETCTSMKQYVQKQHCPFYLALANVLPKFNQLAFGKFCPHCHGNLYHKTQLQYRIAFNYSALAIANAWH